MEPKKNPEIDIHEKRGLIFNLSLVLSIAVVFCVFQWAIPVHEETYPQPKPDEALTYTELVHVTSFETKAPDVPKPSASKPVTVVNPVFQEVKDLVAGIPSPNVTMEPIDVPDFSVTVDPENDTTEFIVVETPPVPVDGMTGFYKTLKENIKYPKVAVRNETEGKVFVQFTVEPTGSLSNLKVIQGVGDGCDEEAVRVVGLTKWKAGKQRGKAVRVRMVVPISFQLKAKR